METTAGHLLGGLVSYVQPREGFRTGIEPVLLAASVPARRGERVLEAGTGAGAGLLCLAARVPGIAGVGVELDPAMAEIARLNLGGNALAHIEIVTGDVAAVTLPRVQHAFANPPWHDPGATASPVGRRRLAKQRSGSGVDEWARRLAAVVAPGGTVTMIVPATAQATVRAALAEDGLNVATLWLRPKADRPAKLAIVQGRADGGTAGCYELVLHRTDGAFTDEAELILRGAGATALVTGSAI